MAYRTVPAYCFVRDGVRARARARGRVRVKSRARGTDPRDLALVCIVGSCARVMACSCQVQKLADAGEMFTTGEKKKILKVAL